MMWEPSLCFRSWEEPSLPQPGGKGQAKADSRDPGAQGLTFRLKKKKKSYKRSELKQTLEVIQRVASRLLDFIARVIPKYLGSLTSLTASYFAK